MIAMDVRSNVKNVKKNLGFFAKKQNESNLHASMGSLFGSEMGRGASDGSSSHAVETLERRFPAIVVQEWHGLCSKEMASSAWRGAPREARSILVVCLEETRCHLSLLPWARARMSCF